MTHRPAKQTTEHVATPFIRREHAVGDEIGNRARVIGNDLERHIRALGRAVGFPRQMRRALDDGEEQIRFKIVFLLLHHGRKALQSRARVDIFLLERQIRAVLLPIKLREDEIPDFQETVSVPAHLIFRIGAEFFALIVENFRIRAARTFADFPKIVRKRINVIVRDADKVVPIIARLIVLRINRHIETLFFQREDFRQKFPRPRDGFLLEIIAERKVSEHFKESMMPRRAPDIFDIARADTFLCRRHAMPRRLHLPREIRLQGGHAGSDQKQTRIVLRHERITRQAQMSLRFKE